MSTNDKTKAALIQDIKNLERAKRSLLAENAAMRTALHNLWECMHRCGLSEHSRIGKAMREAERLAPLP